MDDIRQGHCPLCAHHEILETEMRSFARNGSHPAMVLTEDGGSAYGPLFAFTCRRCGLTQMFARDPEKIPVSPAAHTRLILGAPGQPFR